MRFGVDSEEQKRNGQSACTSQVLTKDQNNLKLNSVDLVIEKQDPVNEYTSVKQQISLHGTDDVGIVNANDERVHNNSRAEEKSEVVNIIQHLVESRYLFQKFKNKNASILSYIFGDK